MWSRWLLDGDDLRGSHVLLDLDGLLQHDLLDDDLLDDDVLDQHVLDDDLLDEHVLDLHVLDVLDLLFDVRRRLRRR